MRRLLSAGLSIIVSIAPAFPHRGQGECGTTRETAAQAMFVHRQMTRSRAARPLVATAASANQDSGDIAIIQDANGVVDRLNQFNLNGNTLLFTPVSPSAAQYRYSVAPQGYDAVAAAAGTPLAALGDDDSRALALPFPFAFFGVTYSQVFVNSDGNLTFTAPDSDSTQRSLGRMTAGPPRIAPLFDDLNPALTAGGVRVQATAASVIVSWVSVPEYSDSNTGALQTFQVALYPDGRIALSYSVVNPSGAVVGIAPGGLQGATAIVDFRTDSSATYSSAVAEVFGNTLTLDVVTVAQQFYQTHEDAYDYLVIYNNMDIAALGEGTVAYEQTVRNNGSGFGVPVLNAGAEFGSTSRLQSVLNMGPLGQYPADPNALVPARAPQLDTPLTLLAHETGHRFLAYASVPDPAAPGALPMLGFQMAHWSFLFDSEASVLEGERIQDRGGSASPEFVTTDLAQGYAPLDQYLMGFRPLSQVPDTFLVQNPSPSYAPTLHPLTGISFNGVRRNIAATDVAAAMGRRIPDDIVAQRRFRFAFILVVAAGTQPSAADLAKVDAFRQQFQAFYAQAASNNATADPTLRRSLKLSLYPAAGVVAGTTVSASLTVATPPAADLTVQFVTPKGNAKLPPSVTIPKGGASVSFPVTGVNSGVEEVQAIPADPAYETAFARVQVAGAASLQITAQVLSGPQVVAQITDVNRLPYAGAGLLATPSADGAVIPSEAFTDVQGRAVFQWNPGPNAVNQLHLAVDGAPAAAVTVNAGSAVPAITAIVNAATSEAAIAPGSLAIISGTNLGGTNLLMNGLPLPALLTTATKIEFYLPADTQVGPATFTVVSPSGLQAASTANIVPLAPGIFPGGVIQAGNFLEIFCTGLGPTQPAGTLQTTVLAPTVFVGAVPLQPFFSGLAPGFTGLYQVNVQVPPNIVRGLQSVILSINNAHSNQIDITVQ